MFDKTPSPQNSCSSVSRENAHDKSCAAVAANKKAIVICIFHNRKGKSTRCKSEIRLNKRRNYLLLIMAGLMANLFINYRHFYVLISRQTNWSLVRSFLLPFRRLRISEHSKLLSHKSTSVSFECIWFLNWLPFNFIGAVLWFLILLVLFSYFSHRERF